MKRLKIMSIFGTRPEATKMAPLVQELQQNENIEHFLCVTAQHREMLDQVLHIFNLKPDFDLNIMKKSQTLTDITIAALKGLEDVMRETAPDLVLVHGDTSTTYSGALAAYYSKIKLGHVEAGLRTYDKFQPFPEEMNRKLTTALADLHFAPTLTSKNNLLKENVDEKTIFITGNTAVDCLRTTVHEDYVFTVDKLNTIDYKNNRVIAMTAHRRENIGEPLVNICKAVLKIVEENEDILVVYAVHYNPLVRETVFKMLGDHVRIVLIDPIDMKDMHNLLNKCYLVLTDSGGLQEEAPALDKPVIVLRNCTERPEGIEAGTLKMAGIDFDHIYNTTSHLLHNKSEYEKMAKAKNPFGDGYASKRILDSILYSFGRTEHRPEDYI